MLAEGTRACRTGPEASSPGVPVGPQPWPSPLRSRLRLTAASRPAERSLSSPLTRSLRQGGPRPPPGRPAPSRSGLPRHASLQSTHGDPGPRAAAAEGTSGPGRPAGAERQAKGRGPRRAGEVALPRLSVPSRARWATLRMLGRGHCGHVSRLRPTAVQAEPGRVPAPGCQPGRACAVTDS